MARLIQQRNIDDRQRRTLQQFEGAHAGADGPINSRVHDLLERAPGCRIRKDNRAKLASIHGPCAIEHIGAKPVSDLRGRFGAGRRDAMREFIGVETRHTLFPKLVQEWSRERVAG